MQPEVKAKLILDGRSVIGGESIVLTVPRASPAPKKAVDFLSNKPIEIEPERGLLAVDREIAPFYVDRSVTVGLWSNEKSGDTCLFHLQRMSDYATRTYCPRMSS